MSIYPELKSSWEEFAAETKGEINFINTISKNGIIWIRKMKILVYNYKGQFALSRKQIEVIQNVLPKEYFTPIQEFHITTGSPGQERFEFNYNTKIAHFEYKVEQKTKDSTEDALEHVLVGLKRIKDKDTFGHFVKPADIASYEEFISVWKEKCLAEFRRIKKRD